MNSHAIAWSFQAPDLVNQASFSPDGQMVAASCADRRVYLLDSIDGGIVDIVSEADDDVNCCQWLSMERLVISCDYYDQLIRVWNVRERRLERTYSEHSGGVSDVQISLCGSRFATAAEDCSVRVWDIERTYSVGTLDHPSDAETVAWSNGVILTGGNDAILRIWDSSTFELLSEHRFEGAVRCVRTCDRGEKFVLGVYGGYLHIGMLNPFRVTRTFRHPLQWERGISYANGRVVVGSFGDRPLVYDDKDGRLVSSPRPTHGANCIVARGQTILCGTDSGEIINAQEGVGVVNHDSIVNTVAIRGSDGKVFSGDYRGTGKVYYLNSDRLEASKQLTSGPINSAVWWGKEEIYCGGYDTKLYNIDQDLNVLGTYIGHCAPIKSICCFFELGLIVTGGADNAIIIWRNGEIIRKCEDEGVHLVNCVASQPSSGLFATGSRDGIVRLWEVETGRLAERIPLAHAKSVKTVSMHPQHFIVLSGSYDGYIQLSVRGDKGWKFRRLGSHGKPGVSGLCWIDESRFAATGWDGTCTIHSIDGDLLGRWDLMRRDQ